MKTAGLMMTTLMASAMGAVTNVVVNDVVTCNADTDCRQHGDTTATCATTGKCTCTAGGNHAVYGTGNNALNLCRPNTNPPANPKVTLYYLLRNIDATNKAVNCDNAGTFTAPYDTLIKGQATTTKGFETVEIVHLCHKSTAGVHTLRTSIKTQVSITNLVSATATTSDPFKTLISDINTALGASTNTALASVGTIDSAETIASTGLGRFCDTTLTHVTAPFVAAPTTTKANNQCKAVSCAKGYSFDKAAATPTCSGPGAFASSNILTCGTATDCAKYGQTGACDATTKKCTAAGTTCVHFSVGTNTLAQCNEAAAPAATDKITLYYILRHGTMTGDSTKAVDCTKESEFTTPYDALIKTAAGFSATELTTVSIVHHCTGTSTLATSIKFEVTVSDLLTNTNSKYSEIANNINDALIQSTDAKLKAVGAVSTVKVGSSEAYTGLCPASGTGEAMQVPMGTNELSTVAGTRDCQAVECSTGYFLSDDEVCTNYVVFENLKTCNTDADCQQHGDSAATCDAQSGKCTCSAGSNHFGAGTANVLGLCRPDTGAPANPKVTLYYAIVNTNYFTRYIRCRDVDVETFTAPYNALINGEATAAAGFGTLEIVHLCHRGGNPNDDLFTSIKTEVDIDKLISTTEATSDPIRKLVHNIKTKLEASTDRALLRVGTVDYSSGYTESGMAQYCHPRFVGQEVLFNALQSCKAVSCPAGYSFDKSAKDPECLQPHSHPMIVTFDVSGELNDIGAERSEFTYAVKSSLGSSTATCDRICLTSSGTSTCWTCEEAASATTAARSGSVLAKQRYTMYYSAEPRTNDPSVVRLPLERILSGQNHDGWLLQGSLMHRNINYHANSVTAALQLLLTPSRSILTCNTATDCQKYGQSGACDANTKQCTAAGTTCVHFSANGNTLAQCNEAAAPSATDKITLYYILRHGTMTGDSTKAVDCTKESEFTTPYNTLIQTAVGFSTAEEESLSIVHHCTGASTMVTSIKVEVLIVDLLTDTDSKYSGLAKKVNDALTQSTDANLKAVGAVESVKVGSSEAYAGLCPASGAGEAMKVPMGTDELSRAPCFCDCQAVECSTGYFLSDDEVCTNYVVFENLKTCNTDADCQQHGDSAATCDAQSGKCTCSAGSNHFGAGTANVLGLCRPDTGAPANPKVTLYCTANTPPPTPNTGTSASAIAVTFDVTGELSTIGSGRTDITGTVASALGSTTATTVCNRVCLTSSGTGTCWTCEEASAAAARSGSVLAAQRYTMHYTGVTALSTSLAMSSLERLLATYFDQTAGISYHANTVTTVYYNTDSDDGLSGGAIAGIVIGCVVFVVIVVVLIYCLCCKKAPESDAASSSSSDKKAGAPDEA
eukprot:TRINITY_DN72_c0_g1_i2.p1 TRINITY_DN72_c0_g1~~TRINITY_DN72_c0_g1_i2.p1  ORF type:complete len:1353 (+),score=270.79 TRINITY_DN72_c0_g1_i2:110-4168(+)